MTTVPTPIQVAQCAARIAPHIIATPTLHSRELDQRTGCTVALKAEPLQRGGSFKLRGAMAKLTSLSSAELSHGVVAFSSGNHAAAVAIAAAEFGIPATIVMPKTAPAIKLDNTRRAGAEIVTYTPGETSRETLAASLAAERGALLVPSYDDADIICGQGTATLELLAACPDPLDALLVPAGGGGLCAGAVLACRDASPNTDIYCVEPAGFDDHARSLISGQREQVDPNATTICDALLVPTPGEITFAINRELAGGLVVTDDQVRTAMAFAFRELKLVVEPGGAVALAALLHGLLPNRYRRVGIMLSGGNVDPALFAAALGTAGPAA